MMPIAAVIDAFGGTSAFARAIGVGQSTASEMKRRGSIPAEYWILLVKAAGDAGIPNITLDVLAQSHAAAKGKLPENETERVAS